jgi:Family of unknown function (DUF5681)
MIRAEVPMFDPNIGVGTRWRKGQSGNAGGRPRSRILSEALRSRLAQVKDDDAAGRTFAEAIADNLVRLACSDEPNAVHAAVEIANRIEGRSRQSIEFADITADLRNRSDEELRFHLEHNRWPSDEEKALLFTPAPHPTA